MENNKDYVIDSGFTGKKDGNKRKLFIQHRDSYNVEITF